MKASQGGQCRRDNMRQIHGCTCSRWCLFYAESLKYIIQVRGRILPRLGGFPWNRNLNLWLMTIISVEKQ